MADLKGEEESFSWTTSDLGRAKGKPSLTWLIKLHRELSQHMLVMFCLRQAELKLLSPQGDVSFGFCTCISGASFTLL